MQGEQNNTTKTFFWDRVRGSCQGIIETGYMGFALMAAIQVYAAPDAVKSIIAASGPIGLFLNPLSLALFSRLGKPANQLGAYIFWTSAVLMLVAAFTQSLIGFLIASCLSFAVAAQAMPLLVHIWTRNYPSSKRGAFLSISMMFAIATHLAFSFFGGILMEGGSHRLVFLCIALAYLLCGGTLLGMPASPVEKATSPNPLHNLVYAVRDKRFGVMLLSWMFLGFGNLMALPLRFEYLLHPSYGIQARETVVTTITLIIPAVARFASSRFWGMLFDRINFLVLRMVLNALIMVSILLFFVSRNLWVMGGAALVLGAAMGGANISWSLWVTKFAAPDKTAAYMSVHTFTTGIRGILAPFLGFFLISRIGALQTGVTGTVLVAISIGLVFALYLSDNRRRQAAD